VIPDFSDSPLSCIGCVAVAITIKKKKKKQVLLLKESDEWYVKEASSIFFVYLIMVLCKFGKQVTLLLLYHRTL